MGEATSYKQHAVICSAFNLSLLLLDSSPCSNNLLNRNQEANNNTKSKLSTTLAAGKVRASDFASTTATGTAQCLLDAALVVETHDQNITSDSCNVVMGYW